MGTHYTPTLTIAAKALAMMLEGMSIRAISRLTRLHKEHDSGADEHGIGAERGNCSIPKSAASATRFVQMDEMWAYIHTREPHLNEGNPDEWGSTMLWLALDSETKLIITHHVGRRTGINAHAFVSDLRKRTEGRYQATSDQYNAYVGAMREHFGQNVDFAQLRKIYGSGTGDGWYGSGQVIGAVPHVKIGRPDFSRISTSHVERGNLSVRMHLRRFTRLTNAFSKTLANLKDAVALYVAFYNFCRVHQTLHATPAMAAGLTDHVWSLAELLATHN